MEKNTSIMPLRMIRIAKDLNMEQMAEYFLVTKAYISALEKGKREMNFRTLKYGLDNLGITLDNYSDLDGFREYIEKQPLDQQSKFKFMLIKTLGVVSPELKENAEDYGFEFIGNIEGREAFSGEVDAIVTTGTLAIWLRLKER